MILKILKKKLFCSLSHTSTSTNSFHYHKQTSFLRKTSPFTEAQTHDLWIASPAPYRYATAASLKTLVLKTVYLQKTKYIY